MPHGVVLTAFVGWPVVDQLVCWLALLQDERKPKLHVTVINTRCVGEGGRAREGYGAHGAG